MVVPLHQITAVLYLAASVSAGAGLGLDRLVLSRIALGLLAAGAVAHAAAFSLLHSSEPMPPLTDLSTAVSFMAWVGTVGFLVLSRGRRLSGLAVLVAPMAFLGVFAAGLDLPAPQTEPVDVLGAGSLPHAHVLLASAGLALLGLAGLAGLFFLAEHRRLKRKRHLGADSTWPSLEALDRTGSVAIAAGFPLLTLGVLTGALWLRTAVGVPFTGSAHEIASLLAWAVYAVLVSVRFGAARPARECAMSAVAAFALLGCAVVGVGLVS